MSVFVWTHTTVLRSYRHFLPGINKMMIIKQRGKKGIQRCEMCLVNSFFLTTTDKGAVIISLYVYVCTGEKGSPGSFLLMIIITMPSVLFSKIHIFHKKEWPLIHTLSIYFTFFTLHTKLLKRNYSDYCSLNRSIHHLQFKWVLILLNLLNLALYCEVTLLDRSSMSHALRYGESVKRRPRSIVIALFSSQCLLNTTHFFSYLFSKNFKLWLLLRNFMCT